MFHLLLLWFLVPAIWGGSRSVANSDGDVSVPAPRATPGTTTEVRVYRLAAQSAGVVTVSDVVVEVGCSVADAEALLHSMVDGERVRMDLGASGRVRFEFPELISRNDRSGTGLERS